MSSYYYPPAFPSELSPTYSSSSSDFLSPVEHPPTDRRNLPLRTSRNIGHPYARLYAKKEEVKRRKIWNHALEKLLFSPYELFAPTNIFWNAFLKPLQISRSTLGAPHRRTIYTASLEAHVERLHAQLLSVGFWPVAFDELEPFKGLNVKTAKSMVSGLQYDASLAKLKLLELERANEGLQNALSAQDPVPEGELLYPPSNTSLHYGYGSIY